MTPENFVYWLQGYFELSGEGDVSKEQVEIIKQHINLVLNKLTSSSKESRPGSSLSLCDDNVVYKDISCLVDIPTHLSC